MKEKRWQRQNLYAILVLIIWLVFFLWLYISGKIELYIKKEYTVFTLIGILILLTVVCFRLRKIMQESSAPMKFRDSLFFFVFLFPILLGIVVRPAGLGSFAAAKRGLNLQLNEISGNLLKDLQEKVEKEGRYSKLTVKQLLVLTKKNKDEVQNLSVSTEGLVYRTEKMKPNEFVLLRFLITCCAADATPLGIVVLSDETDKLSSDSWVKVQGKVNLVNERTVILAENVITLPKPKDPYLY